MFLKKLNEAMDTDANMMDMWPLFISLSLFWVNFILTFVEYPFKYYGSYFMTIAKIKKVA